MEISRSPGIWRMGSSSRPTVDIVVPRTLADRDVVLHEEWRRQVGLSTTAPPLRLPRHGDGDYRMRLRTLQVLDVPIEYQYSDAVAGGTGGPGGHLEDMLVTHVTISGQWRFAARNREFGVPAGTLVIRRNDQPWLFEVDRQTRAVAVGLPVSALRLPMNAPAVTAAQDSPAARLLLAQLRLLAEVSGELSPAAARAARAATVELFQGLVDDQVVDGADFTPTLLAAARDYIDDHLRDDPDLDPHTVARALHVSVRTLYRAFAQEGRSSVMAYARERRLDRARSELLSSTRTVSEVASRWHFADSSYFVKAYRKRFGETPTASRRR